MVQTAFKSDLVALIAVFVYIIIALIIVSPSYKYQYKQILFASANIFASFYFFFWLGQLPFFEFLSILAAAAVHWILVYLFNRSGNTDTRIYWAAFATPIVFLVAIKLDGWMLLGASFMAFRMAQTIFEMRNNHELRSPLFEYIAFILFPPTLLAGPINPFSYHRETSDGRFVCLENLSVGVLRISIGYIKLRFLSSLLYQLTFSANWTQGFRHDWIDFIISGACYYLYLYLNFSGYSDIAIGIAAIIGIRVKENFDTPLVSRNIKDFWRRWHISLTDFVREAVFTPLSMTLVRTFGVRFLTPAVLIAIAATFIVLALWHGFAAGYFIFYSLHASAFAVNQLFEDRLRRRGKAFQKRYADKRLIAVGSQILTFLFLAFTFSFVDLETWDNIKSAWQLIR